VLDLVILRKEDDGSVEAFEISDLDDDELGTLRAYEGELAMLPPGAPCAARAEPRTPTRAEAASRATPSPVTGTPPTHAIH
jgi:hypothetical protein